jgi:hypothetical protein
LRSTGPPRLETVVESTTTEIVLDAAEQAMLESIGRQMARGTDRYGNELTGSDASLIAVRRTGERTAQVRVRDAVGMIATPTLQLHVRPKIPAHHLLHIVRAANVLPELGAGRGLGERDENLAVLIAHWFVTALERVLEEGLARDYRLHRDELTAVRGRLLALDTARLYYRGRLAVSAEFEEYDFDTPLNRLLLNAARVVAAGRALPATIRRRALRAAKRMDGVGRLIRSDAHATTDSRTAYYADAVSLAREVLAATGRSLDPGAGSAWTFLFRTPDAIETGLRHVIAESLGPAARVTKRRFSLAGSRLTVNPDLVFEGVAVGDVKYKLAEPDWDRADLYQAVAFAAAFEVPSALIALFASAGHEPLPPVRFGSHVVAQVCWPADPALDADVAAAAFARGVVSWFREVSVTPAGPPAAAWLEARA